MRKINIKNFFDLVTLTKYRSQLMGVRFVDNIFTIVYLPKYYFRYNSLKKHAPITYHTLCGTQRVVHYGLSLCPCGYTPTTSDTSGTSCLR
jgi:hypothetical protein